MAQRPNKKPVNPFRHWFFPHRHNDHRPHLIRAHGLAILAVLIFGVQVSANVLRPPQVRVLPYAIDITPVDLLNQTNQQRAAAGLAPLSLESKLNLSASLKAGNMFAENYWAHVSPSGIQPWYWFTQAGYNYKYAGENLAMDFLNTSGVMQGWMASAGHRANILNPNYTQVGFAVQNGTLVGEQTTLVVAHYGALGGAPAVAAAKPSPKAPVAAAAPARTPAPTTVTTPAATPSPAPPATATATPEPAAKTTPAATAPTVKGQITHLAPAPQSYSLFKPLSLIRTLNWGTIITLLLLLVLLSVYVMTHLAVWRKGLKRWRSVRYRLFAAAQIGGILVVITVLAMSGFGRVG